MHRSELPETSFLLSLRQSDELSSLFLSVFTAFEFDGVKFTAPYPDDKIMRLHDYVHEIFNDGDLCAYGEACCASLFCWIKFTHLNPNGLIGIAIPSDYGIISPVVREVVLPDLNGLVPSKITGKGKNMYLVELEFIDGGCSNYSDSVQIVMLTSDCEKAIDMADKKMDEQKSKPSIFDASGLSNLNEVHANVYQIPPELDVHVNPNLRQHIYGLKWDLSLQRFF